MIRFRFIELDLLRSLAIAGMIIYHTAYLLDFFELVLLELRQGAWLILAYFVQLSFLGLVGICLAISWQRHRQKGEVFLSFASRQTKRAGIVFGCGLLVTFVTWLVIPDQYVRFGVLHFIGLSIFLLIPLSGRPLLCGLLAATMFLFTSFVHGISVPTAWLIFVGFSYPFSSVDYFPLFPWLGVVLIGIAVGHLLYQGDRRRFPMLKLAEGQSGNLLLLTSRNSLIVYLTHVPVLYAAIGAASYLLH
ncbi:MAG: heparan-alpha-glucosaminide N-acetyltransferase [bacterium]|nr:heparan-alpha-glucosaminide N-acetyltransferase [bacterium]